MKSLANSKATVSPDGKTLTVVSDIVDKNYSLILAQRVSIGHLNPKNPRHPRLVQLSNEAIFVKAFGQAFAFDFDDLIHIATQVNPKTSFAPVVKNNDDGVSVDVISELPATLKWQFCDKRPVPKSTWNDIANSDAATIPGNAAIKGQWIRCVATNASGTTNGLPMLVKK